LTEGVAMENPAAAKGLLMRLRVMGARVALDDFGTGQSSLAYLHQFPADKLKLDRSFICDMESRTDVRDIVAAVTTLAHQLGLEVIAEGVETAGQLAQVRSLGCEYVQGYCFSKPVDKERAAELLRTGFQVETDSGPTTGTAAAAGESECLPEGKAANGRSRLSRVSYVAAAAVVTVALAGFVVRFTAQRPPLGPSSSQTALERTATTPGPAPANLPAAKPPAAATVSAPPAVPAAKPVVYSLPVVHKHAVRGCRGRLTVSPRGVAFVPDKEEDRVKDGFVFKYDEFLSAVSGDELTVTSQAKTYRFKAADASGKDEGRTRIQEIGSRISRLRQASPAK
jgi:hypothetical protein